MSPTHRLPVFSSILCRIGLMLLIAVSIAASTGISRSAGEPDFIVQGVSGKKIVLNRIWERGCIPGTNGVDWTHAYRSLTGSTFTTTLVDYKNGSSTPDCTNGRVGWSTYTQTLTSDQKMIDITWVDDAGKPTAAPAGLEKVTTANAATGLMTAATVTPETKIRADQLNQAKFCGFSDWTPNVSKNTLDCFTGGVNPAKGTIIVDDRTFPWRVYDGIGDDPSKYPTLMSSSFPHMGPF